MNGLGEYREAFNQHFKDRDSGLKTQKGVHLPSSAFRDLVGVDISREAVLLQNRNDPNQRTVVLVPRLPNRFAQYGLDISKQHVIKEGAPGKFESLGFYHDTCGDTDGDSIEKLVTRMQESFGLIRTFINKTMEYDVVPKSQIFLSEQVEQQDYPTSTEEESHKFCNVTVVMEYVDILKSIDAHLSWTKDDRTLKVRTMCNEFEDPYTIQQNLEKLYATLIDLYKTHKILLDLGTGNIVVDKNGLPRIIDLDAYIHYDEATEENPQAIAFVKDLERLKEVVDTFGEMLKTEKDSVDDSLDT